MALFIIDCIAKEKISSLYEVDCMIGNLLMMMTDDEIRDFAAADIVSAVCPPCHRNEEVSIAWERH